METKEKTAAEKQLEVLMKLKEQKDSGRLAPTPPPKRRRGDLRAQLTVLQAAARKAGKVHALPISDKAWEKLVARFGQDGRLKPSKELGDFAARLLAKMPKAVRFLDEAALAELAAKIQVWCDSRHKP